MHSQLQKSLDPYDTIIFVGGGTGGHISPIVALCEDLSDSEKNLYWIGGKSSEEEKEAQKNNIKFFGIDVLKLSTTRSPKIALYPFFLLRGIFAAKKILQQIQQEHKNLVIFSKGWPGSLAIGIAGKMLKIPVFIHESDTIPGRANMQLSHFADTIFLGFESTKKFFKKKNCITIGQIIDKRIRNPIKTDISWKTSKTHILVFCGSQGARSIFEEISKNCQNLDAEWIIVLGKLNTAMREKFQNFENIQVLDWLAKENQNIIFQNTDLAITRGSATTLAELQLFDIPKIIIPLPDAAKNHQYFNAVEYEKQGDTLLEQKNISKLPKIISQFLEN